MKIRVLFFGITHDITGFGEERVEVPEGGKLNDLCRHYERRFPRLGDMGGSLVTAINQELADRAQPLRDGDEVAFLPPVSGGAPQEFYRLTRKRIPTQVLAHEMLAPEDGAVVIFEGTARNNSAGRRTLYLEYEAYEPMALEKMDEIGQQAKQKFPINRVGIIHRLGRVEIGETSVAIIVTAAHRRPAFEACQYAIDQLKQTVSIWKKEFFEDGAVWAEGEGERRALAEARHSKT